MFEQLFSVPASPDSTHSEHRRLSKGVIIGAGQVGMACAYSMLIQNTLDELVLIDLDQRKLEGEVMDLLHGLPFVEPSWIRAGSLAEGSADDADIVIITAGAKQKPGETRLQLVQRNTEIFKQLIPQVVEHCPKAVLLIVSNPVDVMTYVSWKLSGLPSSRVIGSGTVLDTARFRYILADKLQVDPRSLHAYIIGEHGDSEVPVWSRVNVSGMPLCANGIEALPQGEAEPLHQLFEQVKNAAYEVIERKGATSYAIGLGVTQITQAILRNQNRVLTVSTLINGSHDINNVCLSLPAIVGKNGVGRILKLPLTEAEEKQLQNSGKVLSQIIAQLQL
ncbi:L-lactate dehydrogenase [Oculatella sp. LEGE 06141]|uniref:L-lactate dehydrogenase n=1 Tax=Oculatella sp. LEGE 06141 TaxID=1828648 RepID=UPI00187EA840|nr:L-lactate dehydrogenase [Oculatella sp. LEGE 06141]MBE9181835.1 L-lactate dehydrogenase [Oculatella sp. LEGE 06141]